MAIIENMKTKCVLFDWGDTLMRVFPEFDAPMCAWPQVEAMPQAKETLATLAPEWLLGLATNAAESDPDEIRAALNRVHLGQWLDKVYCYKTIHDLKDLPQALISLCGAGFA